MAVVKTRNGPLWIATEGTAGQVTRKELKETMAQQSQAVHDVDVTLGDDIDEVLSWANPNPERIGCPSRETLIALACREQPIGDPVYGHLLNCSACYREFKARLRQD